MICYVVAQNPDNRSLSKARDFLSHGEVIAFPTDTNWVLAVSPFSKVGIKKIDQIDPLHKNFLTLICNSISEAQCYSAISNMAYKLIKGRLPGPYKFIFPINKNAPNFIKNCRKNSKIGIRIPASIFCQKLTTFCEHPLMSITITKNLLINNASPNEVFEVFGFDPGLREEVLSDDVDDQIKVHSYQIETTMSSMLSMIFDTGDVEFNNASSIVEFTLDGMVEVIRTGAGDTEFFMRLG